MARPKRNPPAPVEVAPHEPVAAPESPAEAPMATQPKDNPRRAFKASYELPDGTIVIDW